MSNDNNQLKDKLMSATETVAVLGASQNPERYSNKAVRLLSEYHHEVLPINPSQESIEGLVVVRTLAALDKPVDTLTLYMSPKHLLPLAQDIVRLRPKRVIFNPGTESSELQAQLDAAGIAWLEACTLVMLRTGQF